MNHELSIITDVFVQSLNVCSYPSIYKIPTHPLVNVLPHARPLIPADHGTVGVFSTPPCPPK